MLATITRSGFYPGSHLLGGLPQWSTDDADVNGSGISETDMDSVRTLAATTLAAREAAPLAEDGAVLVEMAAGQGCAFSDLCVHGSQPNLSSRRRLGVSITYCATFDGEREVAYLGKGGGSPDQVWLGPDALNPGGLWKVLGRPEEEAPPGFVVAPADSSSRTGQPRL